MVIDHEFGMFRWIVREAHQERVSDMLDTSLPGRDCVESSHCLRRHMPSEGQPTRMGGIG